MEVNPGSLQAADDRFL